MRMGQQNVLLYVYDELPDDARHELEQHVVRCKDCAAELESVRSFRADFAQFPVQEPNPSFLAASRMRLQEALESAEQGGWWSRLIFDPVHWLNQIRFAPGTGRRNFHRWIRGRHWRDLQNGEVKFDRR